MKKAGVNKYIIYGTGHDGIMTMKYLGKENIPFFCNSTGRGGTIEGIPIITPEELEDKADDAVVVIAVSKPRFIVEIINSLSELGVEYVFWQDLVAEYMRKEGGDYSKLNGRSSFGYDPKCEYIVTEDRFSEAGTISSYFWQDLWAARLIFKRKPLNHYDIGSRVDGFITHLLSFDQEVVQIDIRPLDVNISGYGFVQADATNLNEIEDETIESLSALCSLEHFGLGRYGDPIDPEACFKCIEAIQRVMKKGGYVYISVPIGREHLEFNAHRVFYPQTIVDSFEKMKLIEFSSCYKNEIDRDIDIHKFDDWDLYGGERFGLFVFEKM